MAKKGNMYEKFKIMDDLLRTLNSNITEERHLLSSLRSTTEMYNDLIRSNQKQDKESYSRQGSKGLWSVDNIKIVTDNIVTINDTLVDIREILEGEGTQRQHDNANPLSGINAPGSNGSSSGNSAGNDMSKYVGIAKSVFTALGLSKILSSLGKVVDKSIDATYSVQQITGLNESAAYAYKREVNDLYKGNKYTTGTEEYDRLATIAATTGMDDMDRLLKYSKSIAVGVESMGLDTSNLAELLYTMEKRGTFTSAQLDNVTDLLYRYSATNGEVTPEELERTLTNSLDGLMYGLNMSNEDYQREMEEVLKESATIQGQGFSAEYVSQLSNIINDILLNKVNSQYVKPLAGIGITYDDLDSLLSVGDYSGVMELIQTGLKNNAVTYGDDLSGLDVTRATALGINYDNETRRLLQKYDGSLEAEIREAADTFTSAEDAANDMTRSLWEEATNRIENFFSPVVDWFADKGIGSTELGIAGGIAGSGLVKKGYNWLKGKFGTSADDVAKSTSVAMDSIKYSADDVAKAFGTTADDVTKVFGEAATYSADDIAKAMGTTADDVVKALGTSADDVAKGAGLAIKGASKALAVAGIVIDAGISAYDAYQGFSVGDDREGWQEVGGGIGSIGGGLGGAAAGSAAGAAIGALFGGVGAIPGSIIGGIIGGIGGGIGGDKLGEVAAEGIYDATANKSSISDADKQRMYDYYQIVSQLYAEQGNDAAQAYTLSNVVPFLTSIGISKSITDKYKTDVGKPDFMIDYEKGKLFSYAQGTAFLPQDGLIYAHAGEAIIPAQYNPVNNVSTMRDLQNDLVTSDDISAIYDAIVEMKSTMREFFNLIESKYTKDEIDSKVTDSRTQLLGKKYGFFSLANK